MVGIPLFYAAAAQKAAQTAKAKAPVKKTDPKPEAKADTYAKGGSPAKKTAAPAAPAPCPKDPDLAKQAASARASANAGGPRAAKGSPKKEPAKVEKEPETEAKKDALLTKTTVDGKVVISGTGKDDVVSIDQRANGDLVVSNRNKSGKEEIVIPKAEAAKGVTIQVGDGNDEVKTSPKVTHPLNIEGGAGDDRLEGGSGENKIDGGKGNDRIFGGDGKNTISGGDGNDYIEGGKSDDVIDGGDGKDDIYGLGGNDTLEGGSGRDYIDGGEGDDKISGGDGNDALFGGKGKDKLTGGKGDDVLAGGQGVDEYDGAEGNDTYYHQKDDKLTQEKGDKAEVVELKGKPGKSIKIEGSDRFKARIESDLEAYRSMPKTRDMLNELDTIAAQKGGPKVTINEETLWIGGSKTVGEMKGGAQYDKEGNPGGGTDSTITLNRAEMMIKDGKKDWNWMPSSAVLFHELVHAHNNATGTTPREEEDGSVGRTDGADNSERAAVGLEIDHDGNEKTPRILANKYTENMYRELLNIPRREEY